jgi:HEAT repeat protein
LNANLRGGNARTLADLALRPDLEDAFRVEAIDMLASWADPSDRDRVNNTWIPLAPRSVDKVRALTLELAQSAVVDGSPALVKAFTRLIAAMEVGELSPALCAWVEDPARHTGVRVAALEAMQALGSRELARAVRASLGDPIGRVRAAALIALEELAPEDALVSLPAILEGGEITERRAAYRILGRMGPGAKKHILA